jgi:hypothetical protein
MKCDFISRRVAQNTQKIRRVLCEIMFLYTIYRKIIILFAECMSRVIDSFSALSALNYRFHRNLCGFSAHSAQFCGKDLQQLIVSDQFDQESILFQTLFNLQQIIRRINSHTLKIRNCCFDLIAVFYPA